MHELYQIIKHEEMSYFNFLLIIKIIEFLDKWSVWTAVDYKRLLQKI